MIEAKICKKDLEFFLKNLRYSDKVELNEFLKHTTFDEFFNVCLDESKQTYFLKTDSNFPLALGGAYDLNIKDKKIAQVWLLCTEKIYEHKKEFYKYVLNKISDFKERYDVLFNLIYKSNFSSITWIKKSGFSFVELDDPNYKLFYFSKGDKFDIRYFTCK